MALFTDGKPKNPNKEREDEQVFVYGILEENGEKIYFWNRDAIPMKLHEQYTYSSSETVSLTDGSETQAAEGYVIITGKVTD